MNCLFVTSENLVKIHSKRKNSCIASGNLCKFIEPISNANPQMGLSTCLKIYKTMPELVACLSDHSSDAYINILFLGWIFEETVFP